MLLLISMTFVLLKLKLVSGYASYCDVNQTLFVPKGNSAVFKLNNLTTDYYYTNVWLSKTDRNARDIMLIRLRRGEPFTLNAVQFIDTDLQNRTEVAYMNSTSVTSNVEIRINDLHLDDNGTYYSMVYSSVFKRFCWILLLLDGPDFPLLFSPPKSLHTLKQGETLPEIRCAAVCNPPCSVSWGNHSATDVLRLGIVSVSSSGEYTCKAKSQGNGTMRVVERSVFLVVTDNTGKEMTAIAVLATMQVLTTLFLGVFAVIVFRHFKSLSWNSCANTLTISCQHTEDRHDEMSSETNTSRDHTQNVHQNGAYVADYDDLNEDTKQNTSESENYSTLERDGQTLPEISDGQTLTEVYENTRMSQL